MDEKKTETEKKRLALNGLSLDDFPIQKLPEINMVVGWLQFRKISAGLFPWRRQPMGAKKVAGEQQAVSCAGPANAGKIPPRCVFFFIRSNWPRSSEILPIFIHISAAHVTRIETRHEAGNLPPTICIHFFKFPFIFVSFLILVRRSRRGERAWRPSKPKYCLNIRHANCKAMGANRLFTGYATSADGAG